MARKSTDPFMQALWESLRADKLGPGGHDTAWDDTNVRVRNRFIKAVRQVLQSGAAFGASMSEVGAPAKASPRAAVKGKGRKPDPRELQLPLMASLKALEKKRGR
jgi:hypothetical protein